MVRLQLPLLLLLVMLIAWSSCVDDKRMPPNILEPNSPKTLYFSGNSPVEIKCKAEGMPEPTYSWTKNGSPIVVDSLVQYDSTSGSLTIPDFTKREEGTYMCTASNVFDNAGGRVTASSFAPPVKLFQTRVEKFIGSEESKLQVTEFEYALLKCADKGEVVGSDINTNWYESEKSKDVSLDGGRLFIDQEGSLHFSYALARDATVNFIYLCGISSTIDKLIRLGNANYLTVLPVSSPTAIKPQLQYSNSGVKGLRFGIARLECVFSGYDPSPPHVPVTHWFDVSGKEITGGTTKYTLSEDKRALTISNLQEEDEKNYFCQAKNSAGETNKMMVFLDVTSAPIFNTNGAPKDQTVIENIDVHFNCDARSASNEAPPRTPIWYINGKKMGRHTDPSKYILSNGNKTLTVMKVKKATDILCVQCEVTNHVDTTWADACLNVILPIKINRSPSPRQEIVHGDVIDLTVTASTDPAMTLSYRWEFNNQIYVGSDLPPFMFYDPSASEAFIETILLTEEEYERVSGTYRRIIFHTYQTVYVETLVVSKSKPETTPTPWLDIWIIGLIIGIIFLLTVTIIIISFIRRKHQERDGNGSKEMNANKKEAETELNAWKELNNKDVSYYCRPIEDMLGARTSIHSLIPMSDNNVDESGENDNNLFSCVDSNHTENKPQGDLGDYDVPNNDYESLSEYCDVDDTHFYETGPSHAVYQKKQQPPSTVQESII